MQYFPRSGRPGSMRVPDNISTVEKLILSQDNDMLFINRK